jgi:hypothetical protein
MSKLFFAVLLVFTTTSFSFGETASTGKITGVVVHSGNQEPLPGASVFILGTKIGAATDTQGRYIINNIAPGTYSLSVSLIGYAPDTKNDVAVNNIRSTVVNFSINESALESANIIVTPGYFSKSPDLSLSTRTQSNEEIRRLPGGSEDVLRAISILPGVAQVEAGRNDLIVRGGAPSENLFVVDGIEAQNINHFGTQGSGGGPLSYINLDYVDQTTFSTGGFGARYGDKLSSVLAIELRDGNNDKLGGKATISATQFGLNLEGPLAQKGSFIFTARRSYLDWLFRAAGFGFVPEYYDFLWRANYNIDSRNLVKVLGVGAIDKVRFFNDTGNKRYDNSRILGNNQNQAFGGATWKHLARRWFSTITLGQSYADYGFNQSDSTLQSIFKNNSVESESYLRGDINIQLNNSTELAVGIQTKIAYIKSDILLPQYTTSFGDTLAIDGRFRTNALKGSTYAQLSKVFGSFKVSLGGRADYFDLIKNKLVLSPRFSISYFASDKISVNGSVGRYYQAPSYIWLIANRSNRSLKFINADHFILGIDYLLRPDTKLSIEGFIKRYSDYPASFNRPYLVLANTGAGFGGSEDGFSSFGFDYLSSKGKGITKGIELLAQKRMSVIPCYGLISISFGKTEFQAIDKVKRPGSFDQRLIINLAGGYVFNSKWEIGTKFGLATGRPYTPFNLDGTQNIGSYNSARVGTNHSLDLRVDRRWMFKYWMLTTYFEVQNAYNWKYKDIPRFDTRTGQIKNDASIGIIPSIGISATF